MSHSADPHDAHDEAHDAHELHDDAHDEPPSDEPATPRWLTALGGAFFLLLALGWLAARPNEPTLSELSPAPSASAAAEAPAPPPPPAEPAPAIAPAPAVAPAPAASQRITGKAPKAGKAAPKGAKAKPNQVRSLNSGPVNVPVPVPVRETDDRRSELDHEKPIRSSRARARARLRDW